MPVDHSRKQFTKTLGSVHEWFTKALGRVREQFTKNVVTAKRKTAGSQVLHVWRTTCHAAIFFLFLTTTYLLHFVHKK